jgi:hypothetical protein
MRISGWDETAGVREKADENVLLVGLAVVVKFRGVAKAQHLAAIVAGEDAVRALRFERNHGDVPWTGAIRSRHAATRQTLERFELEHRRRWLHVT